MKKVMRIVVAILMILLAVIPFLVIYEPLSRAIPISNLPNFEAPGWLIPAGFVSIGCIIILSFVLAFALKDE